MSYITLQRESVANTAPVVGYTVTVAQYDTATRRLYADRYQSPTDPGNFELTVGQLVPGASFCYGSTLREVRYAGDGRISTHDNPNAPACASALSGPTVTVATPLTAAATSSGQLRVQWAGATGPVRVRCLLLAPGRPGDPPFYLELPVPAGTSSVLIPAQTTTLESLIRDSRAASAAAGRLTLYSSRTGLVPGRYRVEVIEEASDFAVATEINLGPFLANGNAGLYISSVAGATTATTLTDGPLQVQVRVTTLLRELQQAVVLPSAGRVLLALRLAAASDTSVRVSAAYYNTAQNRVETGQLTLSNSGLLILTPANIGQDTFVPFTYYLPAGWPVGGTATLPVVSNGQGGVQTLRYAPHSRLELANLVLFHPPTPDATTGGALVEITDSYDAHRDQALPLNYLLVSAPAGGGPAQLQYNQSGRFDGLVAGQHRVTVNNGYTSLTVTFTLSADLRHWRTLSFSDLHNHTPCRLELWARGYTGQPEALCGQANPVTIEEAGIQGGDSQADLGPSVGKSMTLRLRAQPGELQDVVLDDRACRADFYYGGVLQFTGFVQPEIYEEALLSGPVDVELTATCGLASLKDLTFSGHEGQELRGRCARLDTLLHCLSRTGLSLPVTIAANLRAAELLTDETPEEAIYTDRQAYADLDLRAVVDALCQSLGGTLVQRNGQ